LFIYVTYMQIKSHNKLTVDVNLSVGPGHIPLLCGIIPLTLFRLTYLWNLFGFRTSTSYDVGIYACEETWTYIFAITIF
jgi:hypothetical protein